MIFNQNTNTTRQINIKWFFVFEGFFSVGYKMVASWGLKMRISKAINRSSALASIGLTAPLESHQPSKIKSCLAHVTQVGVQFI